MRPVAFPSSFLDPLEAATVLIADADPSIRRLLSLWLASARHIVEASNGEDALRTALTTRPDMCVLDLRIPGRSGLEVCRDLRAAHVHEPIMLLTSIADDNIRSQALEFGADEYVIKPFSLATWNAHVRHLLRGSRRHAAAKERAVSAVLAKPYALG
jgi:DNA-binding response OmpR family regulator